MLRAQRLVYGPTSETAGAVEDVRGRKGRTRTRAEDSVRHGELSVGMDMLKRHTSDQTLFSARMESKSTGMSRGSVGLEETWRVDRVYVVAIRA